MRATLPSDDLLFAADWLDSYEENPHDTDGKKDVARMRVVAGFLRGLAAESDERSAREAVVREGMRQTGRSRAEVVAALRRVEARKGVR